MDSTVLELDLGLLELASCFEVFNKVLFFLFELTDGHNIGDCAKDSEDATKDKHNPANDDSRRVGRSGYLYSHHYWAYNIEHLH